MNIKKIRFFAEDHGAVTVDWVVLCAAVVALAGVVTAELSGSTDTISNNIATIPVTLTIAE